MDEIVPYLYLDKQVSYSSKQLIHNKPKASFKTFWFDYILNLRPYTKSLLICLGKGGMD